MGRRSLHWLCAQYAFGGKLCGLAEAESGFHGYGGAAISKRGVDRRSSAGAGDRARRHAKFLRRTGRTADGGQAVYGGGRCRQAQGGGVELRVVAETLWRRRISHWAVHLDGWRAGDGCGYHAARLFLSGPQDDVLGTRLVHGGGPKPRQTFSARCGEIEAGSGARTGKGGYGRAGEASSTAVSGPQHQHRRGGRWTMSERWR